MGLLWVWILLNSLRECPPFVLPLICSPGCTGSAEPFPAYTGNGHIHWCLFFQWELTKAVWLIWALARCLPFQWNKTTLHACVCARAHHPFLLISRSPGFQCTFHCFAASPNFPWRPQPVPWQGDSTPHPPSTHTHTHTHKSSVLSRKENRAN